MTDLDVTLRTPEEPKEPEPDVKVEVKVDEPTEKPAKEDKK